jgi:PemK-like, MazF-like toxin of type II toxin-antitoxin system
MITAKMQTHFKDFTNWINAKVTVDSKKSAPPFREREIWWCSIGINVGMEIDGKGIGYARPVIIIKKFNKFQFWAIPITSKDKSNNPFYFPINYDNKTYYACLVHLRSFDSKRLRYNTDHKVSSKVFEKLKLELKNFI